jgi:hypothetical protein
MPTGKDGRPRLGSKRGALSEIGSMQELQGALGEVIDKLRTELAKEGALIETLPLKAAHTLATLAGVFVRLHETADLEARLSALEQRVNHDLSEDETPPLELARREVAVSLQLASLRSLRDGLTGRP